MLWISGPREALFLHVRDNLETVRARAGLARALSKLGYASRAEAWKIVATGRVRVNGRIERDPEKRVRLYDDSIEVDVPVGKSRSPARSGSLAQEIAKLQQPNYG